MVHEDCLVVMPIHANVLLLVLSWTPDAVDGYVGYIKLWLPVFHIGYFKSTITTLQCICKTCSSILLTEEDYRKFLRQFRHAFPGGTHSSIRMSPLISCFNSADRYNNARFMMVLCRHPRLERMGRAGLFKRVAEKCKRVRQCPHCGATNGPVKWVILPALCAA